MIFVTVGTNETAFERLVEAAGLITTGDEEVIIQTGYCVTRPPGARCVDFLSFDDMVDHARRARIVICHAGVGSIMMSLNAGRRPVVMARRVALGEAVDDHQVPLAVRLADAGLVVLVENGEELAAAITGDGVLERAPAGGDTDLARELQAYLASRIPMAGRVRRRGR